MRRLLPALCVCLALNLSARDTPPADTSTSDAAQPRPIYRYLFLFLHTLNGLFEGRKSRVVGYTTGREQRRWISGSMVHLLHRSFFMSQAVYTAMVARGFQGDIRISLTYRLTRRDWLALAATLCTVIGAVLLERCVS